MQRTKFNLPDAINCSLTQNFTQVPNDLLRNPIMSAKAKAILCLLLSNKEGWHSHLNVIKTMMKEKSDAIQNALQELERFGYLMRVRYRDKQTKTWRGSFWAYTDIPNQFNVNRQLEMLENKGFEPQPGFPHMAFPDVAFPVVENTIETLENSEVQNSLKNTNINNTKYKNTNSSSWEEAAKKNGNITLSQFEEFWQRYPRKVDKGKALSAWEKLCHKPPKERPTMREIVHAIAHQKRSERWQDKQYIPHPTTWLNQSRWLDDPLEMKSYSNNEKPKSKIEYGIRWYLQSDGTYMDKNGKVLTE